MTSRIKIVQPHGILDNNNTQKLRREIIDILDEGAKTILVDFQDVTFINSSGIGALVATLKTVKAKGGELFICAINDQVKLIFELTKMDRVFKVFANFDDFSKATSLGQMNI